MAKTRTPKPRRGRDEFSRATREHIARSVNYNCSKCDAPTAAALTNGSGSFTTGVAAHIRAAAKGGPRYNEKMTRKKRTSFSNGIWLCAAHSPLVDRNWPLYPVEYLRKLKRDAEARAYKNLDEAKRVAALWPVLDGSIDWEPPASNEDRDGYRGLFHAVFTLGGARKHRGRAYIELKGRKKKNVSRTEACIGVGTYSIRHEHDSLRPGQPYRVPVFTRIERFGPFWLDKRFGGHRPARAFLTPGVYITDEPFIDGIHRAALPRGAYEVRVAVILGDTEHHETFYSEWHTVDVS